MIRKVVRAVVAAGRSVWSVGSKEKSGEIPRVPSNPYSPAHVPGGPSPPTPLILNGTSNAERNGDKSSMLWSLGNWCLELACRNQGTIMFAGVTIPVAALLLNRQLELRRNRAKEDGICRLDEVTCQVEPVPAQASYSSNHSENRTIELVAEEPIGNHETDNDHDDIIATPIVEDTVFVATVETRQDDVDVGFADADTDNRQTVLGYVGFTLLVLLQILSIGLSSLGHLLLMLMYVITVSAQLSQDVAISLCSAGEELYNMFRDWCQHDEDELNEEDLTKKLDCTRDELTNAVWKIVHDPTRMLDKRQMRTTLKRLEFDRKLLLKINVTKRIEMTTIAGALKPNSQEYVLKLVDHAINLSNNNQNW